MVSSKAIGALAVVTTAFMLVAPSAANADVRVIHASPDAPNVDVYVNTAPGAGDPAISNLAFRAGTPYIPLPTADYRFRVTPAGLTAPVVIDATTPINASTNYSVVATGFLADIQPSIYIDDNTSNPSAARIRFIHASPDAPTVDIFAVGVTDPLFNAVSFRESGGYIAVPGGSYDLEVRLDQGGALALSVPGLSVQNGFVYTIFAMGSAAGGTLQAVPFVDAVPTPASAGMFALAGLLAARRRR